jgi:predicted aspartyl protease
MENQYWLDKNYYPINLTLIATNHFVAKVQLNDYTAFFIVDTGASRSCLDKVSFAQLNMTINEDAEETEAAGLGSSSMVASIITINQLKLNDFVIKNYDMPILDLSHVKQAVKQFSDNEINIDGVLGADILIEYAAVINYKTKLLYLLKPTE